MTVSSYISTLRSKIGNDLLLIPSVAALIHDRHGRLLLQRKAGPEGWRLPPGGIEPGETPNDALRREVLEETGAEVLNADLVSVLGGEAFRYRYPNGHLVEYTVIVFKCAVAPTDSPCIDTEPQELRYFSAADMPNLALPYPKALLFSGQHRSPE
ncbi:NUDIX domain-containing protein [Thioclava atlantica]|uniref:NUDIX-like protein n=1 Tax=Thioclava atlantica TaxID=1317124 RepID=A0A085U139_9RHOB|nr:NUDIX domain-containing protein [Thioclava atlantica]KFE36686.1 NUDIX-like protein [Thioclava atlantica]